MTSTIAAITTGGGGVVTTADASGNLSLLSGATTILAMTATGVAVTGTLSATGGVTLTTPLPVASGGTGATTVAAAKTALGIKFIQEVSTQTGALVTGTTILPSNDDTIPQNTEGVEVMTLAITPTSATNTLRIDVTVMASHSSATIDLASALFQDSTASAIAAAVVGVSPAGYTTTTTFSHVMVAGTTSSTTFKIRTGANQSGTLSFNGVAGGRRLGGVMASSIRITEYTA